MATSGTTAAPKDKALNGGPPTSKTVLDLRGGDPVFVKPTAGTDWLPPTWNY